MNITLTPEERLERIKEQNRIRAKRYYDNNQAKVLKRRANAKEACNDAIKNCKDKECECDKPKPVVPQKDYSVGVLDIPTVIELIKEKIESENSQKFYANNLKTLEDILGCVNVNTCLKLSKQIIYKIETASQKRFPDKTYSVNTKKGLYQTILRLKDLIPLKLSKNAITDYTNMFEQHNMVSHLQTKDKVQNDEVLDFDEYLSKVKNKFGEVSKEFVVASLYNLSGFRDDLILQIVANPKQTDLKNNYIVIPTTKTKNLSIELNVYKTSGKYGQDIIPIPSPLSKIIRKYVDEKDLDYRDYLFGKKGLSSFIKTFNKKLDLNISINNLRQMKVSGVLNKPDVSPQERVKLSKTMHHKATTSEKYQRKTKPKAQNIEL
jgi:hypothetical protein